jgi:hypothetical protein
MARPLVVVQSAVGPPEYVTRRQVVVALPEFVDDGLPEQLCDRRVVQFAHPWLALAVLVHVGNRTPRRELVEHTEVCPLWRFAVTLDYPLAVAFRRQCVRSVPFVGRGLGVSKDVVVIDAHEERTGRGVRHFRLGVVRRRPLRHLLRSSLPDSI